MPVISNKVSSALQLKVKTGTDEKGNDITANQTYRRVKTSAADNDIYSVAQVISSLESAQLQSVIKSETYELVNQA